MSHIPQRVEKDCLNCGTIVQGHYCQHCGQENVVPKETFWHMVTHFFYDITHFDSSFFHTFHHLLFKPGFLTREYMSGRRARYLHPIRMYVFSSAVFFLLFFTFFSPNSEFTINAKAPLTAKQRATYVQKLQVKLDKDTGNILIKEKLAFVKDTSRVLTEKDMYLDTDQENGVIQFGDTKYRSIAHYDSLEKALPPAERDGWFMRRLMKKSIEINEKYRQNPEEAWQKLGDGILHRLPYMLFVSLPLFALILRFIYIRRRKQFFFADHGVFTIHLYVYSFFLLLLIFGIVELIEITDSEFLTLINVLLFLTMPVYLYIAMLKYYRQGWFKTFLKFLLVSILSVVMMTILFLFFIFFSAFTL